MSYNSGCTCIQTLMSDMLLIRGLLITNKEGILSTTSTNIEQLPL